MPVLPFPEYAPDLAPYPGTNTTVITNGLPLKDVYGPVPAPLPYSDPLPGVCRGYFFARNPDASISIFAATGTNLYRLNNTTLGWDVVSKSGGYVAPPNADQWGFAQFNNFIIAVQINTPPQYIDITSASPFANLPGGPPNARYVAVVNRFLVLTGLAAPTPFRIQWSGIDDVFQWTSGLESSDFQDFPDGGITRGVAGSEYGANVFQEAAIRRMIYVGGDLVFQFERISDEKGIFAALSATPAGDNVFYCGTDGFKLLAQGGYPQPIGKERVDRFFFADVDANNPQFIIGASDPRATRVYFSYKSQAGMMGQFDRVLCYDYSLDRWTLIVGYAGQYMATLAVPGATLESMDTLASGIIAIAGAANSGTGLVRLTLSTEIANWTYGGADTTHTVGQAGTTNLTNASQPTVEVYGVQGTTEANGNWHYLVHSPTQIDLLGSVFTNAYTGGGAIGGAIDSLTFSLDDVALSALLRLSIFNTSNVLNFCSGQPMQATFDTSEQQLPGGRRARIKGFRPLADAAGCIGSVGGRENLQSPVIYSAPQVINNKGLCIANVSTRLARGRLVIPANTMWTFAAGVEPFFSQEGNR
jgi:hypothetical protein